MDTVISIKAARSKAEKSNMSENCMLGYRTPTKHEKRTKDTIMHELRETMNKTKLLCSLQISIFIFNTKFYIIAAGNLKCLSSIKSCIQKQYASLIF